MGNFNYKKYLKNNPLLEDLPKDKWVDLDSKETEEYKEDIFSLISNAYAAIGGHSNYKSPADVTGAEGESDYEVIDLDTDPDIDAVSITKKRTGGDKFVGMGHDGSKPAKSRVINHKVEKLKSPGFYVEVSGKMLEILIAKGVPMVTDEETIRKVLKGKDIQMNDDGTYQRHLGGKLHTKTMMGTPAV